MVVTMIDEFLFNGDYLVNKVEVQKTNGIKGGVICIC